MSQEVLARWSAFQQKIHQRFQEIMQEADAGFRDLVASDPTDAITLSNAASGVNARVEALCQKLQDTFSSQVTLNVSSAALDAAVEGMEEQGRSMRVAYKTLEIQAQAAIYRAMYPLAAEQMQRAVPCTNCGSPLSKAQPHRVEAITCPACHTVVQAAPAVVVSTYFGGAGHAFGEEAAFPRRLAVEDQRRRVAKGRRARGFGDEPLESIKEWERLEQDAWRAYFTAKAQIVPATPQEIDEWVASRMRPFYDALERSSDVWRRSRGMPTR
jgi:hypothetical protein